MGFFSNRRNRIIREKIREAYRSSDFVETNVHWEAFERFANEHGGKTDRYSDGGQDTAFNLKGKEIYSTSNNNDDFLLKIYTESKSEDVYKVFGVRNRMDGTTLIKVQSMDEFKKESSEFLDKISGKSPVIPKAEEEAEAIRLAEENLAAFKKDHAKQCPMCSKFLQKHIEICKYCNYKFE
ncbi:hypothetical protein OAU35_00545 [bacterium]|nr:hypothetical protein [bacterium]